MARIINADEVKQRMQELDNSYKDRPLAYNKYLYNRLPNDSIIAYALRDLMFQGTDEEIKVINTILKNAYRNQICEYDDSEYDCN